MDIETSCARAPLLSSSKGFEEDIKNAYKLVLVVDRQSIQVKNDKIVLTKPPFKVCGVDKDLFILFTHSLVEDIPDDVLTAHICVRTHWLILEFIVSQIEVPEFSSFELSLEIPEILSEPGFIEKETDMLRARMLDPRYKDLAIDIAYSSCYVSDNPVLLDEHELRRFVCCCIRHEYQETREDLEFIITDTLVRFAGYYKGPSAFVKRLRECNKKHKDEQPVRLIQNILRFLPFASFVGEGPL